MWKFKKTYSEQERKAESAKMIKSWNDRVPIILQKSKDSKLEDVSNSKLLCPKHYTYQQFLQGLRQKIKLPKEHALFVFLNGKELLTGDRTLASIYEQYKDPDGFLYIMYCENPTLG